MFILVQEWNLNSPALEATLPGSELVVVLLPGTASSDVTMGNFTSAGFLLVI